MAKILSCFGKNLVLNLYFTYFEELSDYYVVPLETVILLFIVQWTKHDLDEKSSQTLKVNLVQLEKHENEFKISKQAFTQLSVQKLIEKDLSLLIQRCNLPVAVTETERLCVGGLCSVARAILKHLNNESCIQLLGFRKRCLSSCCEVSPWTRFCEIEMLNSAKKFFIFSQQMFEMPLEVLKFENHLKEPLKIHNIGKLKNKCQQNQTGYGDCLQLSHDYAEGVHFTLSDLIIFVCIQSIFDKIPMNKCNMSKYFPAIVDWFQRIYSHPEVVLASKSCGLKEISFSEIDKISLNCMEVPKESLFMKDPTKSKHFKIDSKQEELKEIFLRLMAADISPNFNEFFHMNSSKLKWDEFPSFVHPSQGDLPRSRLERKCDQLSNMTFAVLEVAQDGDVIVDFCSGGGHLGIILAHLLPKCCIIMVENKEESIARLINRIEHLPNTTVYQSNVNYFKGQFNVGVSLHACGTATDLVLQKCLKQNAAFIICPCCYGSLKANPNINYPRSKSFQSAEITTQDFYMLAHAADQTHENGHKNAQGKYCMSLVDTDRLMEAKELNYTCSLFTMDPPNCTLKNNVIMGVPNANPNL